MSFGARLAEERRRLGLRQAEFAGLVGADVAKQSLYETGRRELRADYLARLAAARIDVLYILTGERSEASPLAPGAGDLLSAYYGLPPDMRQALLTLADSMRERFAPGGGPTLHAPKQDYRGQEGG